MHGIASVSIDLQSYGGDKVMLELSGDTWSGSAIMPIGVSSERWFSQSYLKTHSEQERYILAYWAMTSHSSY